jgi:hypothetical protein
MKKLAYLLTVLLIILGSAVSTPIKSQTIDPSEPYIGWATWDNELGFCHGPATNCYVEITA